MTTIAKNPTTADKILEVPIKRLILREPFLGLFPIDPKVVTNLAADMKVSGFSRGRPVTVWSNPPEGLVLTDGFMRLQAAGRVGLTTVWAEHRPFADEREAFEWTCAEQGDRRRNLTREEFRKYVQRAVKILDRLKPRGGDRKSAAFEPAKASESSAAETAKKVGISESEVKRIRRIQKEGDPATVAKLEAGESPQRLVKELPTAKATTAATKPALPTKTPPAAPPSPKVAPTPPATSPPLKVVDLASFPAELNQFIDEYWGFAGISLDNKKQMLRDIRLVLTEREHTTPVAKPEFRGALDAFVMPYWERATTRIARSAIVEGLESLVKRLAARLETGELTLRI